MKPKPLNFCSSVDHIVYVKQPPLLLRDKSLADAASGEGGYQQRHSGGSGGSNSLSAMMPPSSTSVGPKKSLKSFRNASCDVGSLLSGGLGGGHGGGGVMSSSSSSHVVSTSRRQSVAKMQHHTVEAPITKVISIILAAQENSPQYIAQALDKVSHYTVKIRLVTIFDQTLPTNFIVHLKKNNWRNFAHFLLASTTNRC